MDVKLPDGTIIKNVPDGTSKADLVTKLKANGMNVPDSWGGGSSQEPTGFLDRALSTLGKYGAYASDIPAQAEVLAHYGSGALSAIPAGLAGLATGGNADVVNKIQNALTYPPRTQGGKDAIGAIDQVASLPAQAGDAVGGRVADATGSPALGAGANTFIQSIPMLLGAKGARGLVNPEVPLKGADLVKAQTLAASTPEGLVVPPSLMKSPPAGANLANGFGGVAETNKMARETNSPIFNNLAASDLGLPKDTPLTNSVVKQQIQSSVDKGYAPLKELGDVPVDTAHRVAMAKLGSQDRAAASIDPRLGNPQIAQLADALSPEEGKSWDSKAIVDTISALRGQAADAFASGNNTLGKAYKQGASSLESLLDRHLTDKGADGAQALADFRNARIQIAKGHDVLDALNTSTGDVDPRILAKNDDGQMTGGLATAANFARAFPDASVPAKGTAPGVTAFQANVEPSAGPVGATLNLLGRPAARKYALSADVQKSLASLQPKRATLSARALGAVFANPTAFSSMYENQK